MKLEPTVYANYFLMIGANDTPVGVQINGVVAFELDDVVYVSDDGHGYICPNVTRGGLGKIVEIRRDDTDHFFGVQMDNGQFGYMKRARLMRL
ncbi:MAG: hypothetical protein HFJ25_01700 [Clostridia bacterium]|jgi:hypothetical protein|nr:hypothetical protein [Clostridia bacterium]